MAIISQQYFNNIAQYLKTPIGKISTKDGLIIHANKNQTITGTTNIIIYLLQESKSSLTGSNVLEDAQIRQWLEYTIVYVENATTHQNIQLLLKDLNNMLSLKTYLVGNRLTIADACLYYALVNIMASLSYLDKEKFLNVSRWFDNIQQDSSLRQKNNLIDFSTNYLANLVPARH